MNSINERELIDTKLVSATIRMNLILFAITGFIFVGFGLMLVTLFATPHPDHILNMLTVFLPGYSLSVSGSIVALFWGGAIGSITFALCYKFYSLKIVEHVQLFLQSGDKLEKLEREIIPLDSKMVGLIFAFMSATNLFITTMYLVSIEHIPGKHIILLSYWLPHYDLSVMGAIIGSIELGLFAFLFWFLVASLYNKISRLRTGVQS